MLTMTNSMHLIYNWLYNICNYDMNFDNVIRPMTTMATKNIDIRQPLAICYATEFEMGPEGEMEVLKIFRVYEDV